MKNPGLSYIASLMILAILTTLWLDHHHTIIGGYLALRQYAVACVS